MNPRVVEAQYAVRGALVIRAEEIAQQLAEPDHGLPFDKIVFSNIGNPQQLGQQPLTFYRQLLAACQMPELIENPSTAAAFPEDVVARAKKILGPLRPGGVGAYTHSKGMPHIRQEIADFIERRDGYPADSDAISIYNGASPAVQDALRLLIRDDKDGIMIPIPQYPLYSASIALCGGRQVGYLLDEDAGWSMSVAELQRSLDAARAEGTVVRALAIINPGNPTGQVLDEGNMREVVEFCRENGLVLMADEVYQENVYAENKKFHSFKKVLRDLKYDDVQLLSFHSVSKGFSGECGQRGGYSEAVGFGSAVMDELYKLASVCLCSNTSGQIILSAMLNPPQEGDASYPTYRAERDEILGSLKRRALKLAQFLNTLEGVSCNNSDGAMYAFPQIRLSAAAVEAARAANMAPDAFYAMEMLENTGICVVPGSGFGQKDGTFHFRTTFLPSEQDIDVVMERLGKFHAEFIARF